MTESEPVRSDEDIRADVAICDEAERWSDRYHDAVVRLLHDVEPLLVRVGQLTAELARAKSEPLGDNHHNAAMCPYCSAQLVKERDERNERLRVLTAEREKATAKAVYWYEEFNKASERSHNARAALQRVRELVPRIRKGSVDGSLDRQTELEIALEIEAALGGPLPEPPRHQPPATGVWVNDDGSVTLSSAASPVGDETPQPTCEHGKTGPHWFHANCKVSECPGPVGDVQPPQTAATEEQE